MVSIQTHDSLQIRKKNLGYSELKQKQLAEKLKWLCVGYIRFEVFLLSSQIQQE